MDINDIEKAILGSCLVYRLSTSYVMRYCDLQSFTNPAHRTIYKAMYDTFWDDEVDPSTVAKWLKDSGNLEKVGGTKYLTELMEKAATPHGLPNYVKEFNNRKDKKGERQ